MSGKLQTYKQLYEDTSKQITTNYESWTSFLNTAARLYKYPYNEQVMIYAQRPDATACASFDIWNRRMGRYVLKNSKGIALIDTSGYEPKLKYVFDIADTGTTARSKPMKQWKLREENIPYVSDMLYENYALPEDMEINQQLDNVAYQLVAEYWDAHQQDIFDIVADSFLNGYDDYNIEIAFKSAASISAAYMLMSRCGRFPERYFDKEEFFSVYYFNTPEATAVLGTAVSQVAQEVLRQIEAAIRSYERDKDRIEQAVERMDDFEPTALREEWRLPDSQHRTDPAEQPETAGQVREHEESLPERTPPPVVEQHDSDGEPVSAPERNRGNGEQEAGTDDAGTDEPGRRDRGPESERPDDLGGADEQPESTGRRSRRDGADLQLTLFPGEDEQIQMIEEAESEPLFAFSMFIPDDDLDIILRLDGNTDNARMMIANEFSKGKSDEELAAFIKQTFHGGNGVVIDGRRYAVWYGEDGIRIAAGNSARYISSAKVVTWMEAAERIRQLLEVGNYATNLELAEAPGFERKELAEQLWFIYRDLTDEAKAKGILASLTGIRNTAFPDETARLTALLNYAERRNEIIQDYNSFVDAYTHDRNLLRFHHYEPKKIQKDLQELQLPRKEYTSECSDLPTHPRFITEDEITAALSRGNSFAGGKSRIYDFFLVTHTPQEQTAFLSKEYGIGGRSHAVSRASHSYEDFSSKGISLKKQDCPEVQINWKTVAKRISELVQSDRYLTPEEKAEYESAKQRAAARIVGYTEYNAIKEQYPDDLVLFEVGDFFELYGEDARTAAKLLNISLTTRTIEGIGRVDMCGFPGHRLEENAEKLHETNNVVLAAIDSETDHRQTYFLRSKTPESIPEIEMEIPPHFGIELIPGETTFEIGNQTYLVDRVNHETGVVNCQNISFIHELGKPVFDVTTIEAVQGYIHAEELLEQAKSLITEYMQEEFGYDPDFRNLSEVNLAYTTTEEGEIPIQVNADLEHWRIEKILGSDDDSVIEGHQYNSLQELIEEELVNLDFASLVTLDDETMADYLAKQAVSVVIAPLPEGVVPAAENFRITDDNLGVGGAKAKFRMNMDAINMLHTLENENRMATSEEQEVLAKYVGWGGLSDAFDPDKENWSAEYDELLTALTPEEYADARASTLNAHYTSPIIIRAIYTAIENMGFQTGNILEPSMGVGNFFGMLPEGMRASNLYGVELDCISGQIARHLYPHADITVGGFETTDRRDFYDLAVGNVPFGQYQVNDRAYNRLGFSIHDYFFAKALDQVRPGGVIAFVTSRYTMDKQNPTVRKYIAQRAELLGAIRLPNNAFKANAGTEVVSDILFLQKREAPIDIEPDWVHLGLNEDGFAINSYFIENPEMVLGRQTSESTQYGKRDFTVEPYEDLTLDVQLSYAIQNIRGTYTAAELPEVSVEDEENAVLPADPNVKNFSYTIVDGEVYYRQNSVMVKPDLSTVGKERVKGMVKLRDCVYTLINQQMNPYVSDTAIQKTQAELNELYDNYTGKYGLLNSRGNSLAFADDSSYFLLCSLEILDEDKKLERKADIFTKRTIKAHEVVTSVDTASEALALSISERACVDMAYMSQLTGKDEDTLAEELVGVVFRNPLYEREPGERKYLPSDEYLSGNVRVKLREAVAAQGLNEGDYSANIEALKAAQPVDLEASDIEVRLGATWIAPEYIKQFMFELFEPPVYCHRSLDVNYSAYTAEWSISGKSSVGYSNINAYMTYGTDRASAYKILEDTLNLRDVRIYDTVTDRDGKQKRVLNSKETTLAQQKQQAIKDAFQDWIWKDPERRHTLVTRYNELFNSTRPREYDGRHITFPGMNPEIKLREHQLNAVAHVLYGGNTLLAHEVGSGKTFEMVAAAMESKRLGLCQKSLFVVPNHLITQWASEFLRLYPSANLLVATKKDFEKSNRKKFCARIATGDYDAVIIGHSQFERIPVSYERQERMLQEQIDEISEGIRELKESRAEKFTVKSLEKTKRGLETRLRKLIEADRKDDVVTFEQLGIDRLFVDEAHSYKNCYIYTKMRNVAGLTTTDAQKSSDMLLKCRYLDEITDSKGIVFATGTPVSNSMTELYTMMRYLQHDTLRKRGLAHFDCWASTFGETQTAIELAPEGTGYRARTRFAKFFNLPELMTLFKEVADIKTADQLDLPRPDAVYHNVVAQPTEIQQAMVKELSERAARVHSGAVDASVDNMLKITTDGRKLGLDQRVINPDLPDEPNSKVNLCVENIYRIYDEGQADKLTQLLFCDLSTPKVVSTKKKKEYVVSAEGQAVTAIVDKELPDEAPPFSVYDDIREKLIVRGIPREEIAYIHEANTDERKKELFAKVRSGKVRVLMGSTLKMGAGMNVHDRLIALHDLDAPWKPGDLEQRSGRIIRQGNMNPEVQIYRYVTEATFDAYLWQTLEKKQTFISQIMTSKSPVRSCDDVDETALSYAEIKALCAGDERIKEKMDLDVDVARLKLMKASHKSQQYRLEDNILRTFPAQIAAQQEVIAGYEADLQTLAAHPQPKEGFIGMEVYGVTFHSKDNAGGALLETFKDVRGLEPIPIGHYRGFEMFLTVENFGKEFVLTLKGEMAHRVQLGKDARGNLIRIDNVLNSMPERLRLVEAGLANVEEQLELAKQEVGRPFPQEEELQVKSARLAGLNAELNIDDRSPMEQIADEADVEVIEKTSVIAKLKQPPTVSEPTHKKKPAEMEER